MSMTSLFVGTRNWKLGPPMRKPWAPEKMPDLRHNLMDGWAKWWPNLLDSMGAVTLLDKADLWWVGAEMCDLLYATMPAIPGETRIENLTLPSKQGLVFFENEWAGGFDAATGDRNIHVNAITWTEALVGPNQEPCLSVTSYRYVDFGHMSYQDAELAKGYGLLDIDKATAFGITTKLKDVNGKMEKVAEGGVWAPLGRSDWPLSAAIATPSAVHVLGESPYGQVGTDTFDLSAQEDRRLISALFSLLDTASMTTIEERGPSRQVVKQALRKGTPVPLSVKVVYLRRPRVARRAGEGTEGHHLSHRFAVRAHPRMQAYGPHHSLRRLIMVPGYIKGPQDAPFVPKTQVNAWVR